jgi:hypothetical protein
LGSVARAGGDARDPKSHQFKRSVPCVLEGGRDAIAVLAVKAKPLRGRFASLDRSARRWLLLAMSLW